MTIQTTRKGLPIKMGTTQQMAPKTIEITPMAPNSQETIPVLPDL